MDQKHEKNHAYKHGGRFLDKPERLYTVWRIMRSRCNCVTDKDYKKYGGRGISVCEAWNNYATFRAWAYAHGYVENAPKGQCTLERIDVDGNYCPENCRWATMKEQANNRRNNVRIEYQGETHTLREWAEMLKIPYSTLQTRHKRGWDIGRMFSTPPKKYGGIR